MIASIANEDRHAVLQRDIADAILSDDAPIPATIQLASGPATASRFGVYRNNVLFGLMNALAARYPVSREILWPDSFEGAARLFVIMHPPRSPVMLNYGDDFPNFLRSIGTGSSTEYVADIAALESARVGAYHAPDATPLAAGLFEKLSPEALPNMRFKMHPSVSLLRSRFPVVSAWEAARGDGHVGAWKAEAALVARPFFDVQVWRLPPGGYEFFLAISNDVTIAEAVSEAAASDTQFDLAQVFQVLICAGAVVGIVGPT
jgi:hypothetical protein